MWRYRFKETKEPFVITSRIGYQPIFGMPSSLPTPVKSRPKPRIAMGPGVKLGRKRISNRLSPTPRALPMPHGCKQKTNRLAERQELKRQAEEGIARPFLPKQRRTCTMCGRCGKYYQGYRDEERGINAIKTSRILAEAGFSYTALELVNIQGKTMPEMVTYPVQKGYALRHRIEKWYWTSRTGRVWFNRAGDAQGAWCRDEKVLYLQENRKRRTKASQQKLIMTRGNADGTVEDMPNWVC